MTNVLFCDSLKTEVRKTNRKGDKKMRKQMHKEQYFHFRAIGDILVNDWIDANDHSKGKSTAVKKNQILPKGGATVCYLPSSRGKSSTMGISFCSPRDNFKKEIGRIKSKGKSVSVHRTFFKEPLTFEEAAKKASELVTHKRIDVSAQNAKKFHNALNNVQNEHEKFEDNLNSLFHLKKNKVNGKV